MSVEYVVRVNQDDDGGFWAEVLELPGCFATGDTLDELREALEESIALYLHDGADAGPKPSGSGHGASCATTGAMRIGEMRVSIPT